MNKVAIVTGGNRGIGAATSKVLARNGYKVCLTFNNSEKDANDIVEGIEQLGGTALCIKANIADEEDILNLFSSVDKVFGPVTTLINNAGINGGVCEVEHLQLHQLQNVYATNVFGTFLASREAVKRMKQAGGGNIINITSEAANFGGFKMTTYASSKAAINTFTKGFAREVAANNIRVNAISPGIIATDMQADIPQERLEILLKSIPMGRMGTPEEVAELVAWLISDKASYVSGAIFSVNGSR